MRHLNLLFCTRTWKINNNRRDDYTRLYLVPVIIIYDRFSWSLISNCCCNEQLMGSPSAGAGACTLAHRWRSSRPLDAKRVERSAAVSQTRRSRQCKNRPELDSHPPRQPSGNYALINNAPVRFLLANSPRWPRAHVRLSFPVNCKCCCMYAFPKVRPPLRAQTVL